MKYIKFLLAGVLFGIIITKAQVISWYRIQEMFRFDSFHMYGIIGSAVVLGMIIMQLMKRFEVKSLEGEPVEMKPKNKSVPRYILGGFIFGLGWALTGACPGPIYTLIGNGFSVFLMVLGSALLGTFIYGLVRHKLPH